MSTQASTASAPRSHDELSRNLSSRHVQFIALGTAIGTGLFYGSSETIQAAGPAVLVAYLIAGFMVFIVMRALGEMAVRYPVAGSFAQYSNTFLGPFAGFLTGWIFWLELAVVAIADMTAVATYMGLWFPGVPGWLWMVLAVAIIGGLNLLAVQVFGELEFWFSLIKVVAILALVVGGIGLILWGANVGGTTPDIANLWQHGGFAPFGLWGIIMSFSIVVFSFGGVETLGMTAGEAGNPERSIARAVNSVPFRILLFYVAALAVIMAIFPWNQVTGESSPFVEVFAALKVPAAQHIMNFVVLTAALSAMNAIFYAGSRTLYGLAEQGHAPKSFLRLSRRSNIPVLPVMAMFGVAVVGLFLFIAIEKRLFFYVAAIATFATVFTWLMILLAHWRMRSLIKREGAAPGSFRSPLFPVLNAIAIAFIVFVIVLLALTEGGRSAFIVGVSALVILAIGYALFVKGHGRERLILTPRE
ncbi:MULTISPECIES: amino acid permease [Micrococcaceae]|uniref:Histidine transporter n=1 Tax=Falsarthrobacter nasiphocae TaxID=189863 RepID=A0AAE4C5W5_9MICC|nr:MULTISPECIES: amino acid permease [Micrococcaceae]MDO4240843.1 amino acid permease [Micrococcus sp.]MDR6891923.1 histidine transporter [Falsarthrobacter nasiphocae]